VVHVFDIFLNALLFIYVLRDSLYVNWFCIFLLGIYYHFLPLLNTFIVLLKLSTIFC
jgi:hypothetical protein